MPGCSAQGRREAERPRRLPAHDFAARLVELRRQGLSYKELAAASGLSVGTCHRIINEDVKINSRSQELLDAIASKPARPGLSIHSAESRSLTGGADAPIGARRHASERDLDRTCLGRRG